MVKVTEDVTDTLAPVSVTETSAAVTPRVDATAVFHALVLNDSIGPSTIDVKDTSVTVDEPGAVGGGDGGGGADGGGTDGGHRGGGHDGGGNGGTDGGGGIGGKGGDAGGTGHSDFGLEVPYSLQETALENSPAKYAFCSPDFDWMLASSVACTSTAVLSYGRHAKITAYPVGTSRSI